MSDDRFGDRYGESRDDWQDAPPPPNGTPDGRPGATDDWGRAGDDWGGPRDDSGRSGGDWGRAGDDWQSAPPPPHGAHEGSRGTTDDWGSAGPAWGDQPVPVSGQPAGVGKRVGAYILDSILLFIVFSVVAGLAGLVPTTPEAVAAGPGLGASLASAGLTLGYFVLLEAGTGQTLAKRLLGVRAVMADGSPMTIQAAFTRRIAFVIGTLIPVVGGLIGFAVPLAALITAIQDEPGNQGFHDRWASTRVVEA